MVVQPKVHAGYYSYQYKVCFDHLKSAGEAAKMFILLFRDSKNDLVHFSGDVIPSRCVMTSSTCVFAFSMSG